MVSIVGEILNGNLFLKNIRNGRYSLGLVKTHLATCSYLMKSSSTSSDCKTPSMQLTVKNEKYLSRKFNHNFDAIISPKAKKLFTVAPSERFHSHEDNHSNNNHSTGWLLLTWSVITLCKSMDDTKKDKRDPEKEAQIMADEMYLKNDFKGLYHLLVAYKNTQNAELLWRLARAHRDLAQLSDTKAEDKKRLTYEGFDAAKNAVDRDPNNFACHKWYGIMLSAVGDYEGNKKKIEDAYVIYEHFDKAIQLRPDDATSHHLLGIWCFSFAELPWYQRKLAAAIFASPPTSTYEEALTHFEKAETIDPGFYSTNQLMLAKSYISVNKIDAAKYWLSKVVNFPAKTEEDHRNIEEAQKLLRKI